MEHELIRSQPNKSEKILFLLITLVGVGITIAIFCDGGLSAWWDYATYWGFFSIEFVLSWGSLLLMIIGVLGLVILSQTELVVTDQRVYGKATFTRVDIPLDSVSSIGVGVFHSVVVASSSGKIKFFGIQNNDAIHTALGNLLRERSSRSSQPQFTSSSAELKELKELLDSGVITQEEFDAKKRQLLGI
jgi:hypothetical protein